MNKYPNLIIASFDVDPQNGFTPNCPNELPVPEGHLIVNELNKNASLSDYRVGSRDSHPVGATWEAKTPEDILKPVGTKNVDVKWPSHCIMGTFGWQLLKGLPHPVEGYDFMVNKGLDPDAHPYGACYHDLEDRQSTGVIEFLKSKNVDFVIVGGLATEYCVFKTVTQLVAAGITVILNTASVRGLDGAEEAIKTMKNMANVIVLNNSIEINTFLVDESSKLSLSSMMV